MGVVTPLEIVTHGTVRMGNNSVFGRDGIRLPGFAPRFRQTDRQGSSRAHGRTSADDEIGRSAKYAFA
jgi:hypothetical protein